MLIRDQVYQILKNDIISGVLKPGEVINMLDISNRMNISGAPVREALNMLCRDGLVDMAPYRKPVVASGTADDAKVSWDLRLFIEPYAARLSVKLVPEEAIAAARDLVLRSMEQPDSLTLSIESDEATHALLYQYANSRSLTSVLETLRTNTMRYRYLSKRHAMPPGTNQTIAREHLDILDAISLRDENLVYFHVFNHLKNSGIRNKFE